VSEPVTVDLKAFVSGLLADAEARAIAGEYWVAGRLLSAAKVISALAPAPPPELPKEP
jgi:hypothetical protein